MRPLTGLYSSHGKLSASVSNTNTKLVNVRVLMSPGVPGEEKVNELLSGFFFAGWVTALNPSSSGFVHACIYHLWSIRCHCTFDCDRQGSTIVLHL